MRKNVSLIDKMISQGTSMQVFAKAVLLEFGEEGFVQQNVVLLQPRHITGWVKMGEKRFFLFVRQGISV